MTGEEKLSPISKISFAMQKASARLIRFKKIMVCISGGSDSDVMLDLLLRVCPREKMNFVFFDTGIEYEATKRHLSKLEQKYNITIERQRATVPVPLGVKKYGVPFLSKYASEMIHRLQLNNFDFAGGGVEYEELLAKYPRCETALKWWCNKHPNGSSFNISRTYALKEFMIENPPMFLIDQRCCEGAKKNPAHHYEREHDFDCKCMGLRRAENGIRSTRYKNCYTYDPTAVMQNMRPIWWFTDEDKDLYITTYDVQLSDCYLKYGMKRTGCAGCPFGSHFEEELKTLSKHEPKLYKAVVAIFGDSYEYTRKYREFKVAMKKAENGAKQ